MSVPTTLDFTDIIDISIPVTIPMKDKSVKTYSLGLLNGKQSTLYENTRMNSIKFDANGKPKGFTNSADMAPLLVSLCLTTTDGKEVTVDEVNTFPATVLNKLHETAKEINNLNKKTKDEDSITKIFNREDTPCSLQEIRTWLGTLDQEDPDVQAVVKTFSIDSEEKVKN